MKVQDSQECMPEKLRGGENGKVFEDDKYNKERRLSALKLSSVPPKYINASFDSFIGNDKIKQLCADVGNKQDMLLIGPTGCGKTHLAVSTMRSVFESLIIRNPLEWYNGSIENSYRLPDEYKDYALFTTVPEMLMDLRSVFSNSREIETEKDVIEKYKGRYFLILDDLGAEKTTDYALSAIYTIIDHRINYQKRTIITTNLSLQEIEEKMDARLASRLSGMKVIKINMPDFRKKRG